MILLVTGGRDYADEAKVDCVMSLHATPVDVVVHGDARGLDTLVAQWCEAHGVHHAAMPALWDWEARQGNVKVAGHKRNEAMLLLQPKLCLVFPGGRGTADMARKAYSAGLEIIRVAA